MTMTENVAAKPTRVSGLVKSVSQSLMSFSFSIGGLLTGTLLILYFNVFSIAEAPWALILFPGVLSVRGAIGGLFSGHLSTGLHLGTIKARYTKNTRDFHVLIRAVVTLALLSAVAIGAGASVFGVFLWKATPMDFVKLLAVVMATMAMSVVLISPITIAVSVFSFRRGLDPDIVAYPIISTIADIIDTACYILSLYLFFTMDHVGFYVIGIVDLAFLSLVLYIFAKNLREKVFAKMIREFLLTLVFVTVIVNVTGAFLQEISGITRNGTQIYIVYPALITTIGGLGSIVGSTATTKLALGVIRPSFSSIRQHLNEIGGAWVASIVMFAFYFLISSSISGTLTLSDSLKYAAQLLITNALAAFVMVIVSYAVAVSTYRRGWDPDNFVIPIESSLADSVTTISLLIALTAIV